MADSGSVTCLAGKHFASVITALPVAIRPRIRASSAAAGFNMATFEFTGRRHPNGISSAVPTCPNRHPVVETGLFGKRRRKGNAAVQVTKAVSRLRKSLRPVLSFAAFASCLSSHSFQSRWWSMSSVPWYSRSRVSASTCTAVSACAQV